MSSSKVRSGVVILLVVALVAVMIVMLGWSVPHLVEIGGGRPFDIRFTGYDHAEAVAHLKALGPEGRAFYDTVQINLDTAFPVLYFLCLSLLLAAIIGWAGLAAPGRFLVAVVVVGLPTVLDFAENAGIRAMIRLDPDAVTADLVARTSFWSTTKWLAALFGVAVALVGSALALARHRKASNP